MAIKINAQVTGDGPQPSNAQALVVVTVEFDGPSEGLTFTVPVPSDSDESMIREQANVAGAGSCDAGRRGPQGPLTPSYAQAGPVSRAPARQAACAVPR